MSQLQALGSVLFTEYRRSIFLISILLFLSRVGALTLTLSIVSNLNIGSIKNTFLIEDILITKSQNVSYQLMRNSNHILKLYN